MPVPDQRKPGHVKFGQDPLLKLQKRRPARDDRQPQPGHHRLLDRLVRAKLHPDLRRQSLRREEAFRRDPRAGPLLAHHENLPRQVRGHDGPARGQRMIRRRNQDQRVFRIGVMFCRDLPGQGAKDVKVVLVPGEPRQKLFAVADGQRHVDPRMAPAEIAQPAGNVVFRRRDDRHPKPPARHAPQVGQRHLQPLKLAQNLARGGLHNLPRLGQVKPLADPFDQHAAQLILKLANLGEDGGLGQVQVFRRAGVGQGPGDGGRSEAGAGLRTQE